MIKVKSGQGPGQLILLICFMTAGCVLRQSVVSPAVQEKKEIPQIKKNDAISGSGLGVEPGKMEIENVPAGRNVSVSSLSGKKLIITNKDRRTRIFSIKVFNSKETDNRIKYGYEDIPDASWLRPEYGEIEIESRSRGEVDLFVNIPDQEEYLNKKYQAVVEVRQEKNNPKDLFVTAVQVRVCIAVSSVKQD